MKPEDMALFERLPPERIMGLTIFGEAEGEKFVGKFAVGYVIQNRAVLWKQTVSGVCLAPNQFECFNEGNPRLPVLRTMAADWDASADRLKDSLTAARGVLSSNVASNVGKATFYKVTALDSPWFAHAAARGTIIKVAEIGKHEFFEETRFKGATA